MSRTLPLAAAVIVCFLATVAGPALSADPYVPEPVDFELSAPAPAPVAARGGREYVSPPLHAPKRFNLVGLRWRGSADQAHLRVRVKRDGGRWTRWRELGTGSSEGPDRGSGEPVRDSVSAPAWAGQADWVQYRSERRLPGVRLHFVNTTGTATPGDRRRTAFRRAVNGGVVALAKLPGALVPDANAADERPAMVSRDDWGAENCPPRSAPAYGEVKLAFVHHTVNLNDYSRDEAASVVLGICRFHRNSRGWNDIGYNFLVDKYGTIYEGRAGGVDQPVMGAQAQGFNSSSAGIANIGTFESVPQSNEALDAMARLIRWKLPLHGAPTSGRVTVTSQGGSSSRYAAGALVNFERVSGHRDANHTSCPGTALYAQLPELRRRVEGATGPSTPAPDPTRLSLRSPKRITYPKPARLSGSLVGGARGLTVYLQRMSSSGAFRSIRKAKTGTGGKFAFELKATRRAVVRVRYPGSARYGASQSRRATVQVRPAIRFTRPPSLAEPRALISVPGTIKPSKSQLRLQLQRRSGERWRAAGTLRVKATRGRFKARVRLSRAGSYRLRLVFPGDSRNVATHARWFEVQVSPPAAPPAPDTTSGEGGTAPAKR